MASAIRSPAAVGATLRVVRLSVGAELVYCRLGDDPVYMVVVPMSAVAEIPPGDVAGEVAGVVAGMGHSRGTAGSGAGNGGARLAQPTINIADTAANALGGKQRLNWATGESPPPLASTACLPHDRHLHPPTRREPRDLVPVANGGWRRVPATLSPNPGTRGLGGRHGGRAPGQGQRTRAVPAAPPEP